MRSRRIAQQYASHPPHQLMKGVTSIRNAFSSARLYSAGGILRCAPWRSRTACARLTGRCFASPERLDHKKKHFLRSAFSYGAAGRGRTDTVSLPRDFESRTSASSITPACAIYYTTFEEICQGLRQKNLSSKKLPSSQFCFN